MVLGLFEDVHRCFDGLSIRKMGADKYFKDGPYYGNTLNWIQPMRHEDAKVEKII